MLKNTFNLLLAGGIITFISACQPPVQKKEPASQSLRKERTGCGCTSTETIHSKKETAEPSTTVVQTAPEKATIKLESPTGKIEVTGTVHIQAETPDEKVTVQIEPSSAIEESPVVEKRIAPVAEPVVENGSQSAVSQEQAAAPAPEVNQ